MTQSTNIWQKAAIAGSLWASFEIILGSLLHNLHIPMGGTFLAFLGISLMIAFHRIWKEKGLFWRAGLICALMKSISPSAIIFGPMIGIFLESALLEAFVRFLGANMFGYIIAASAAMNGVLLQKTANYLITYGWNFVRILENLYIFMAHQIHMNNFPPMHLLGLIISIYCAFGMAGAILGYRAGQRAKLNMTNAFMQYKRPFKNTGSLFVNNQTETSKTWLLPFNFLAIIAGLCLINLFSFMIGLIFTLLYCSFCIYRYKQSVRYLKKTGFWVQILILTVAAALFYDGFQTFTFSYEGILVGLKMDLRALMIIFGFTAISVELRNPLVKNILTNKGLNKLYQSTSLAFTTLPDIIANMPASKSIFLSPVETISKQIIFAGHLYKHVEKEALSKSQIIIITGFINSGKTTLMDKTVQKLQSENIKICGFLSVKVFTGLTHIGYNLVDLNSKEQIPLARRSGYKSQEGIGHYFFASRGLSLGRQILLNALPDNEKIIIIDEVGRLELNGKGWADQLDSLAKQPGLQIWVVRNDLINEVIARWRINNPIIVDVSQSTVDSLSNIIHNELNITHKAEAYA